MEPNIPPPSPGNQVTDFCRQPHSLKTAHLARRPGRWGPSPQDSVDPSGAHHRSPHPQISVGHLPTSLRVTYQHPSPTNIPQSPVLEPVEVTDAVPLIPRVSCVLPTLVLELEVPPSLPSPPPPPRHTHVHPRLPDSWIRSPIFGHPSPRVSLVAQLVKNPPAMQESPLGFLGGQGFPWRRDRLPTPVLLRFPGGSAGKESARNAGDLGSIPGWGRSPGGGKGYPLWCPGLQNPMDRGAWQATVHGVAESGTGLSLDRIWTGFSQPQIHPPCGSASHPSSGPQ